MWQMADELGLPRAVFVNKMDRENVSYESTLDALTEVFGRKCLAVQLPDGAEASFSGVVSLLGDGSGVADEMREAYDELREKLLETIAEADDDLMMKYLEGEELTDAEVAQGLRQGIAAGDIVPVLFGAAGSGIGAAEVMDLIVDAMPSPADGKPVQAEAGDGEVTLAADAGGPLAAQVFKTSADPFVGKLSYIRVVSGEFKSDQQVWNSTRGEAERVGQVYVLTGKEQEATPSLAPGDIGAVAKLSSVLTGDTLTERGTPMTVPAFTFPTPVYQMAAYPKSKADVDKITTALARITEEDPSLSVQREPNTGELLLGGLGDVHVEVAVERMQRKFGVELELRTPRVPYMETITRQTQVEYRHKKQSGGHGQFGHVYLDIEPLQRGGGFEFAEKVVGGSVPREYIPSVEKGCRQALAGGAVSGYPLVDLRATLYDGSFHPVDSSGVSFEIAGSHALSDGIKQAGPIILEPVMRVDVRIPDSDAGDVMGDLNGKRARILGMTPQGDGTTIVEAEAPQAEMLRYATDLRSQTQGRGSFTISFDHYDPRAGPHHRAHSPRGRTATGGRPVIAETGSPVLITGAAPSVAGPQDVGGVRLAGSVPCEYLTRRRRAPPLRARRRSRTAPGCSPRRTSRRRAPHESLAQRSLERQTSHPGRILVSQTLSPNTLTFHLLAGHSHEKGRRLLIQSRNSVVC